MRRAAVLVAAAAFAAAPAARADGTESNAIAATANRVWVAAGASVVELDATTGRRLFRVGLRYPYALSLGLSDGNVWATSVTNGFGSGALSRIPFDGSRAATVLAGRRPPFDLAVAARATWALVGPWRALALARVDHVSLRVAWFPLATPLAWLAGDYSGRLPDLVAVTRAGRLVRVDDAARLHPLSRVRATARPALAFGTVWTPTRRGLAAVDAGRARIRGRAPVAKVVAVVAGGGAVWALAANGRSLARVEPRTLGVTARVRLPARVAALAYGNGAVWLATVGSPVRVLRLDPRSKRLSVFARLVR
ncbi:MAG TPA: hypothetical protein VFI10_06180 [Gaiellaceae bacterium]|jgi:hypothetical protein|nr:hypothetical protein [Gaiellaceae bacterium]